MPMTVEQRKRRALEKRLKKKYTKRIVVVGIICLIAGLIIGLIIPTGSKTPETVTETVYVTMSPDEMPTPQVIVVTPEPTEEPAEQAAVVTVAPTVEPAENTPQIVYVTAEPTEEPAAAATAEPVIIYITPEPEETAEEAAEPVTVEAAEATEEPAVQPATEATEEPAAEPAAEATEEPAAEPETVEATEEPASTSVDGTTYVDYGKTQTITTEIVVADDGTITPRTDASQTEYETVEMSIQVAAYKDYYYFEKNYGDTYNLQGGTGAVEFDVTLLNQTGNAVIIPQNCVLVTVEGADPSHNSMGYQLMDKEIAGETNVVAEKGVPVTCYKRFPLTIDEEDMKYMVVTAYVGGQPVVYKFDLENPNADPPIVIEEALSTGSKGDEVEELQLKLESLGLLEKGSADGIYGKGTAAAVSTAQAKLGMEETGKADQDFVIALFKYKGTMADPETEESTGESD